MPRVALVCMPWASVRRGSIALGILKRALRHHGIAADTHYLNVRLAGRMHAGLYESISNVTLLGDWLFSQHLFGAYGSGELANDLADITRLEGRGILAILDQLPMDAEAIARNILPAFMAECLGTIPWGDYDVVGFTSVFVQHAASLLLAKRIKDRWPGIRIIMGGSNLAGSMGRENLRVFEWIDAVVDGEGDEVLPQLVQRLRRGEPVRDLPGVSCRDGEGLHFAAGPAPLVPQDCAPIPDYAEFFDELRRQGLRDRIQPRILYEGARGCWWGEKSPCTFCSQNGQAMPFRAKPPRRLRREMRAQSRRHDCLDFEAVDNVLDPRQLRELMPRLVRDGHDFRLFYDIRTTLTRRQVAQLRAAGVRAVEAGIESVHDGMLRLMGKGTSALQNIQFLKWCAEQDIAVTWHLLFGIPGERPEFYPETLAVAQLITHLPPPLKAGRVFLQRFSPYFQEPGRWGIRNVRPTPLYRYVYPSARVRLEELAFHFEWDWPGRLSDRADLVAPLQDLVADWRQAYQDRRIQFYFRRGHRMVELLDNRPLAGPWRIGEPRRTVLKGLAALAWETCVEARPLRAVAAAATAAGIRPDTPEEAKRVLDDLVRGGLMIESRGKYLALAVPWYHPH
jgi:ribosomal peptide maturation radical SAM protein 1